MALTPAARGLPLPPFTPQTRLLVVAPHPDDETIANGILIQRVRAAGGTVRVLLLTDGDNNPWPQRWLERRWFIGAADRVRWGRRRRAEGDEALRRLGLPARALQPLGWPDLGVLDRLLQPDQSALAELGAALADFAPDAIALPALDDRHPDHGAAHVLVRLALACSGCAPALLAYRIHGHADGTSLTLSSIMPAHQAAKRHALAAYRSQLSLSGGRLRRLVERVEQHASVLPGEATRELPWRPSRLLWPRLRLVAASTSGLAQQWRWRDAPLRRDESGGWRLDWPAVQAGDACFVRLSLGLPTPWIFDHWGWREV